MGCFKNFETQLKFTPNEILIIFARSIFLKPEEAESAWVLTHAAIHYAPQSFHSDQRGQKKQYFFFSYCVFYYLTEHGIEEDSDLRDNNSKSNQRPLRKGPCTLVKIGGKKAKKRVLSGGNTVTIRSFRIPRLTAKVAPDPFAYSTSFLLCISRPVIIFPSPPIRNHYLV